MHNQGALVVGLCSTESDAGYMFSRVHVSVKSTAITESLSLGSSLIIVEFFMIDATSFLLRDTKDNDN